MIINIYLINVAFLYEIKKVINIIFDKKIINIFFYRNLYIISNKLFIISFSRSFSRSSLRLKNVLRIHFQF